MSSRKKSIDITNLPEVPQIPTQTNALNNNKKLTSKSENNDDQLVTMLSNLREREASLYENIKAFDNAKNVDINHAAEMSVTNVTNRNKNICEEECRDYMAPLISRTNTTLIQLFQTKESLDQLDSLHRIVHQLLAIQEQNYQMRKRLNTVKTLNALKEMEIQVSRHMYTCVFIGSSKNNKHDRKCA